MPASARSPDTIGLRRVASQDVRRPGAIEAGVADAEATADRGLLTGVNANRGAARSCCGPIDEVGDPCRTPMTTDRVFGSKLDALLSRPRTASRTRSAGPGSQGLSPMRICRPAYGKLHVAPKILRWHSSQIGRAATAAPAESRQRCRRCSPPPRSAFVNWPANVLLP